MGDFQDSGGKGAKIWFGFRMQEVWIQMFLRKGFMIQGEGSCRVHDSRRGFMRDDG